jgi:ribosome modulation factor
MNTLRAYVAGYDAFLKIVGASAGFGAGGATPSPPYPEQDLRDAWFEGWTDARRESHIPKGLHQSLLESADNR